MARKTYTKRVKVTKTGKLLRRKKGSGHNKTKNKTKVSNQKRNMTKISGADRSNIHSKLK